MLKRRHQTPIYCILLNNPEYLLLQYPDHHQDRLLVLRTIPSYRVAAEIEKAKWKSFRQMLNRKDKKLFDEMLCYPQLYNSAGSNAVRPELWEPIIMSIIFEHYKQLEKLQSSVSEN